MGLEMRHQGKKKENVDSVNFHTEDIHSKKRQKLVGSVESNSMPDKWATYYCVIFFSRIEDCNLADRRLLLVKILWTVHFY